MEYSIGFLVFREAHFLQNINRHFSYLADRGNIPKDMYSYIVALWVSASVLPNDHWEPTTQLH